MWLKTRKVNAHTDEFRRQGYEGAGVGKRKGGRPPAHQKKKTLVNKQRNEGKTRGIACTIDAGR